MMHSPGEWLALDEVIELEDANRLTRDPKTAMINHLGMPAMLD